MELREIHNGATYENNYARAAAYCLGTCAAPPDGGPRLAAHALITGLYAAIFRDASALGYKPVADFSFAPWEPQKGREKDIKAIRGAIDKIDGLVAELFALAEAAERTGGGWRLPAGAAPGRALKKALGMLGVAVTTDGDSTALQAPEGCIEGLKTLAATSRAHTIPSADRFKGAKPYLYFSRCVFEPSARWSAPAFDALLGADGRLTRLCDALEARGYERVDCYDGQKITLDYVKQYGRKREPLKQAWGERTHAGISLTYEELRLEPCFLWLRMPLFQTVLQSMERLPADAAAFIASHTKVCDGCRYCVQTDKSRTRPLACVRVGGRSLCPHYPGFSMNWRALPDGLDESLLCVLDALEGVLGA